MHTLATTYPATVAAFTAMGALDHLDRIAALDASWAQIRAGIAPAQECYASGSVGPPEFDLIYAGGGLGLIHAAVMAARYGRRVLLFDRGEVGCAHREWNISRQELHALVATGVFGWDDMAEIVMREYADGVVRFHAADGAATELRMRHVLDVALDAGALLRLARERLEQAGGTVLDFRAFQQVTVSPDSASAVAVTVARPDGGQETYTGRLLLDGMGSASPLAMRRFGGSPFAGVCPTVGTVVSGLEPGDAPNQHQPHVGDILLTVADAQRGQQYMWEGFPGRGDELTVYLFYYDTLAPAGVAPAAGKQSPVAGRVSPSLLALFEDYFRLLPSYKRPGPEFSHHKPVYGYIPARHSLRRQETPLLRGVLPIGDSAAQQSPLTFCGFGSHVRNLGRTTELLNLALDRALLQPADLAAVSPYQANVALNWVMSRFMQPWRTPQDVNALQNSFLGVLSALGEDTARRFFRDEMRWADYHPLILGMLRVRPAIVLDAWHVLGGPGCAQWAADYLRFSWEAIMARAGQALGPAGRNTLVRLVDVASPAAGLRVRARLAEWRAMRWG